MPPDTGMVPCTAAPGLGAAQLLCPLALRASLHPPSVAPAAAAWKAQQSAAPHRHIWNNFTSGTRVQAFCTRTKKKRTFKKKVTLSWLFFFNHLKKRYSWKPPLVVNV